MKTLKHARPLLLAIGLAASSMGQTQVTVPTNNCNASDWVGTDITSPFPLRIMQNDNWPIQWWTDTLHRMQLYHTNLATLNGYTNINRNGFLAISPVKQFYTNPGPFSRLHLVDSSSTNPVVYAQDFGYRPWMRNGITFTGNSDQAYVGHRYGSNDVSDLVLQWSDNPYDAPWSTDRLKFIFTNADWGDPYGARSEHGLETFRIFIPNDTSGYVGIGDFNRATVLAGSAIDPAERLDVLDGRLRIRQLPKDPDSACVQVMVVDTNGVVHWRPFADFVEPAASDCDWTLQNANISGTGTPHNVYTAVGSSLLCPDDEDEVGIGTTTPSGKLTVHDKRAIAGTVIRATNDGTVSGTVERGLHVTCSNGTSTNMAVQAESAISTGTTATSSTSVYAQAASSGTTTNNRAVHAYAYTTGGGTITVNHGLYADARSGATNFGVEAVAVGNTSVTTNNYAIRANATGGTNNYGIRATAPGGPTNWAGYFNGRVMITDSAWVLGTQLVTSDAMLKQNVQDLQNALNTIVQLAPKTYQFDPGTLPQATLPTGPQIGLIAQEVEAILPEAVGQTTVPAELDSLGNEVFPARSIKGIDYLKMIPLLIGAVQEQQAQIQQLQQDLATCCTLDDTGLDMRSGVYGGFTNATNLENDRLIIAPNPFQERTTLSYLLDAPARVRLQVHTESGMHLATLRDQPQEPGSYSMTWDTQDLAPGLYYVTLFADGKPVVKKAVKVR